MSIHSRLLGSGSYLPEKIVTNDELSERVDTSDEWIAARTGIRQRRVAAENEHTSDMAYEAAKRALDDAGVDASEVDLIIVGTTTPDRTFPATAVQVQAKLELNGGAAFDVQAVCSGFIYGMSVADGLIKSGQSKTALVIGADTLSRLLDWDDRTTCVLFGDGAGAVVMKGVELENGLGTESGVLSTHLHSDGRLAELLYCDGGPSTTGQSGFIRMQGKEVFKHAVTNLANVVTEALDENGLESSAIDWLVPHQANKRIIDSTARKLGMETDKIVLTVQDHANTSAASIPLALDAARRDGRIKEGDLILMEAMGGGLTWGAALVRW